MDKDFSSPTMCAGIHIRSMTIKRSQIKQCGSFFLKFYLRRYRLMELKYCEIEVLGLSSLLYVYTTIYYVSVWIIFIFIYNIQHPTKGKSIQIVNNILYM